MVIKQFAHFPRTCSLLYNMLPLYEFLQPVVFAAFLKHCKSEELARRALTVGYYPLIQITDIHARFPKIPKTAQGVYHPAHPKGGRDVVFIHDVWPRLYESNPNQVDASIVEVTALHEMVHWARHIGGNPEGCIEAGVAFENEFRPAASRGGRWCSN